MLQDLGQAQDVKDLDHHQLTELAARIRQFLIASVCRTGGHLGPNLGIVEVTLALHRVFESPRDLILWDTGHQAYVHKLLTGRTDFSQLRQEDGVSGYPSRAESEHDVIENSHASTALSYADGLAKAWQLRGMTDRTVVAVVGDGAMTGGMAWEGLNNLAAAPDRPIVIVLNDNGRSYAETFGGLAQHLRTLRQAPEPSGARCLFTELGIGYLGPVDGHDTAAVEAALRQARSTGGPVLVHCITEKGRGYSPAENDARDRFHGIGVLDPRTGSAPVAGPAAPSWTSVFGEELTDIADRRTDVVAITAAMLAPVGLERFAAKHPRRVFDVGIAEQHAVTSAAGLAAGGLHPVVAVYATFLNRAFDQVLLDVALHRAGVTFVLDRAGITGDDGASHNGMWDMSILQVVPGLRLAAPRDAEQLRAELREAVDVSDAPTVIRFPKGAAVPVVPSIDRIDGVDVLYRATPPPGSADDLLLISFGALAETCVEVGHRLAAHGVKVTVVDPRWIKPVNETLLDMAARSRHVVTVEDNVRTGGCGAAFHQALCDRGIRADCLNTGIPPSFLAQGTRSQILRRAGLVTSELTGTILRRLADDKSIARRLPDGRAARLAYAGQVAS